MKSRRICTPQTQFGPLLARESGTYVRLKPTDTGELTQVTGPFTSIHAWKPMRCVMILIDLLRQSAVIP